MKLKIGYFDSCIDFTVCPIWYLQIESRSLFNNVVQSLAAFTNEEEGKERILLSQNDKEIEIHKHMDLVVDYFNINLQSRSFLAKLTSYINQNVSEEDKIIINRKIQEICAIYDGCIVDFDMDVEYDRDISYVNFTKLLSPHIQFSYKEILMDRLTKYVKVIAELKLSKIIVFVNPYEVLETAEVYELMKLIRYLDLYGLFIMNYLLDEKFDDERIFQIDSDYEEYVK